MLCDQFRLRIFEIRLSDQWHRKHQSRHFLQISLSLPAVPMASIVNSKVTLRFPLAAVIFKLATALIESTILFLISVVVERPCKPIVCPVDVTSLSNVNVTLVPS